MKHAIGSSNLLNFIIVFLVIIFTFLIGTVLYYQAYKANTIIADAIEKYEGYNRLAISEINNKLGKFGYAKSAKYKFDSSECENRHGETVISVPTPEYMYCIYEIEVDDNYYKYGVQSYIKFELPGIKQYIKIPIYSETERIYYFNE